MSPTPTSSSSNDTPPPSVSSPPEWIGITVFAGFIVSILISMLFCMLLSRYLTVRRRRRTTHYYRNLAAPAREAENSVPTSHRRPRIPSPRFAEKARTYKQLQADANANGGTSRRLPDQCGSSVECVICLERFQDDSLVRMLPCCHVFHAECIAAWFLKHHDTCPICKARCTVSINAVSRADDLVTYPPRVVLPFSP